MWVKSVFWLAVLIIFSRNCLPLVGENSCLWQWRILIRRSGLAEGYTMRHCTVPLVLTPWFKIRQLSVWSVQKIKLLNVRLFRYERDEYACRPEVYKFTLYNTGAMGYWIRTRVCERRVKQNNGLATRNGERFAPVSSVAPTELLAGNDVYIYYHCWHKESQFYTVHFGC